MHGFIRKYFLGILGAYLLAPAAVYADEPPKSDDNCRLTIVIPQDRAEATTDIYYFKAWLSQTKKKLGSCDHFVTGATATTYLAMFNIEDSRSFDPSKFLERQLTKLRDRRAFTHVFVMRYSTVGNKVQVRPEVYNAGGHLLELETHSDWAADIPITDKSPKSESGFWRSTWRSISLRPNAIIVGASSASLINQREQNGEIIELGHQQTSILPPMVNGLSATKIVHPDGFASWDISTRSHLSFNLLYFNDTYQYRTNLRASSKDPSIIVGDDTNYSIQMYGIAVAINEEVTFHTPVGGLFLSVGLGGAPYIYHDTLGEGFYGLSAIARGSGGYRAFFTDRFFFQAAAEVVHPMPQFISNEVFVSNVTAYYFAGIGMFLPGALSK